jgi:hypothetical protein
VFENDPGADPQEYKMSDREVLTQQTLVALTWEAIFDQFPSLIRDEIRAAIAPKRTFMAEQLLATFGHWWLCAETTNCQRTAVLDCAGSTMYAPIF